MEDGSRRWSSSATMVVLRVNQVVGCAALEWGDAVVVGSSWVVVWAAEGLP